MKAFVVLTILSFLPTLSTANTGYQQICVIDSSIERYFHIGNLRGDRVMAVRHGDEQFDSSSTVPFYRCICPEPDYHDTRTTQSYCSLGYSCGIPLGSGPVECFKQDVMNEIARMAWPVFMTSSISLLIVLIASFYGIALVKYLRKLCLSQECRAALENVEVEELWQVSQEGSLSAPSRRRLCNFQRYRYQSTILQRARIGWQREWINFKRTSPPSRLCLATKRYVAQEISLNNINDDDNDKDDQDDAACSICFAPLEVGDKIGDLSCGHEFHAACLKIWLGRRNTCPLCQAPNIASYKRDRCTSIPSDSSDSTEEITNTSEEQLQLL